MPTICFLIPYFGRWPEWMPLYLASCARNPTIHWTFITDCGIPVDPPPNTTFIHQAWPECAQLISERCRLRFAPRNPYKLCDFKFAFGDVFREHLIGYDFWAFGDIDVVYGNLGHFLTEQALSHDLLTFNRRHVSGHLTILRNCPSVVRSYQNNARWLGAVNALSYRFSDEDTGFYGIGRVHSVESYNTPLSPYIPWTNGRFEFPSVWYYENGVLRTNIDGDRQFMYLHFMRYKYSWRREKRSRIVHFDPAAIPDGWKLRLDGFHRLGDGDKENERGGTITVAPAPILRRRI